MPSELIHEGRHAGAEPSIPLGTATWMPPAEARSRLGFNDRLFTLNSAGLWEGRSDGQIWLGEAIDATSGALGYTDERPGRTFASSSPVCRDLEITRAGWVNRGAGHRNACRNGD
jgi:hypothetical protein